MIPFSQNNLTAESVPRTLSKIEFLQKNLVGLAMKNQVKLHAIHISSITDNLAHFDIDLYDIVSNKIAVPHTFTFREYALGWR